MAAGDERISQLALLAGAQAVATDLAVVVDTSASETKRMTLQGLSEAIFNLVPSGTIDLDKLNAASVTKLSGEAIALGSLQPDRLVANSLTAEQLAPNSVGASELAASAVDIDALQDLAVTEPKLAASSVSTRTLQSGAVDAAAIGLGEVLYNRLQTSAGGNVLLGVTSEAGGTYTEIPCTPYIRILLSAFDAEAAQQTLELGPLATATGTWAADSSFSGTSSGTNTGDQTITLTGAVTGSGSGAITTVLTANAVAEENLATGAVSERALADTSVAATKLADNSATLVAAASPSATGAFIGQSHFNPINGDHFVWDGLNWLQTSGITEVTVPVNDLLTPVVEFPDPYTLTLHLNPTPQLPNLVWAGPESGALAVTPTFRALVAEDLPPASPFARGAVRLGDGLLGDGDGLTSLAAATTSVKGGVYIPAGSLSIDGNGALTHTLSGIAAGTYTKVVVNDTGHITDSALLEAGDIPGLNASILTEGVISPDRIDLRSITRQQLADYSVSYIQEADPGASEDPHNGCLWLRESTAQLSMWNGNSWFPVGFGRLSEENLRYCGTFRADTGTITGLTLLGINESFSIGQAVPSATDPRAGVYLVCDTTGNSVGVLAGTTFDPGDWILCNGSLGAWVRIDSALGVGSGGTDFLGDLLNVSLTSPATGDLLGYSSGGLWVNTKPKAIFTPITAGQTPTTGQLLAEQLLVSDTTADPAIFMKRADGTVVRIAGVGAIGGAAPASTTVAGIVELATSGETQTGTDALRAVTPEGLKATLDGRAATESVTGLVELATLAEVDTGTDTTRAVTPAGVKPLLDAKFTTADASESVKGIIELATLAEVSTGTDTTRAVTPAGVKPLLDAKFTTADASETVKGIIELATQTEVNNGTDTTRAVTTATLVGRTANDTRVGVVELATSAETQTGSDATRAVTPAGLASRTATDARTGLIELATQGEVDTGTDAARAVTPSTLSALLTGRFGAASGYAKGSLLAGSEVGVLAALGVGTNGQILKANSAAPLGIEWVVPDQGTVTNVTGVGAISVANGTTTPAVSVDDATTAVKGVVQLSTATGSTSTNEAATPSAVKLAYDLAALAAPLASPVLTGNPTAPTPAALDDDTSIATTAFVQAAVVQSGPLAGFRNVIINGNFDVWQRGTTFALNTSYLFLADRWRAGHGSGTGKVGSSNRQAFALGQTEVPGEPTYYLRTAVTTAGSGYVDGPYFFQKIEGVRTFAGQQVTLSFWARRGTTSYTVDVRLAQKFGTGGSPSAQVDTIMASALTLTTTWAKYTYTVTLPSISGKTVGTNDNDQLEFTLVFPSNSIYRLDIAQVQLEPGPVATPFERRPIGVELALCQRYYVRYSESTRLCAVSRGTLNVGYRGEFKMPVSLRDPASASMIVSASGTSVTSITSVLPVTGFTNLNFRAPNIVGFDPQTNPTAGEAGVFGVAGAGGSTLEIDNEL